MSADLGAGVSILQHFRCNPAGLAFQRSSTSVQHQKMVYTGIRFHHTLKVRMSATRVSDIGGEGFAEAPGPMSEALRPTLFNLRSLASQQGMPKPWTMKSTAS